MAELALAIVGLSVEFGRTGKKLKYYTKTLTYAKEEMTNVLSDTKTCGNVLLLFGNALAEDDSPMAEKVHDLKVDADLKYRSECLLEKLKEIVVKRLKPMHKRNRTSMLHRGTARCLWLFQKDEVEDLKKDLGYVSALVHMCISLVTYGKLKNTVAGMSVMPEELKRRIKAMEKSIETQSHAIIRMSEILAEQSATQAAQADAIQEMTRLFRTISQLAEREISDSKEHRRAKRVMRRMGERVSIIPESESADAYSPAIPSGDRSASASPQNPPPPPPGPSEPPQNPTGAADVSNSNGPVYCHACGRYHIYFDDWASRDLDRRPQASDQSPPARAEDGDDESSPDAEPGSTPGSRRTWMRTEGPPIWVERPHGGQGSDDTEDIPPVDDGH